MLAHINLNLVQINKAQKNKGLSSKQYKNIGIKIHKKACRKKKQSSVFIKIPKVILIHEKRLLVNHEFYQGLCFKSEQTKSHLEKLAITYWLKSLP